MKTLKDFTSKIQAKIPEYIKNGLEGVFNGERYNSFDIEKAKAAVYWNYAKCGFKKPIVLVTENIYEQQLMFNILKANKQYYQIVSLLFSIINNLSISNNINSSQLGSQLRSQLYSQLDSQLDSQVDSQLTSQLGNQLHSQLRSQLRSHLRSQLRSKLSKELNTYNSSYLFTLNVYSDCYYQYFKFIKNEFKIPLTIENDFEECFSLQRESGIYSAIFSEAVCIVSKYPKKIYRDDRFRLHNTSGQSVEWGSLTKESKFDCYYIHGRNMNSSIFNTPITKDMFINESNEEIRGAFYEILGEEETFKILNAVVIDSTILTHKNGDSEPIVLYKTKENMVNNKPLAWVKYICPSTQAPFLIPCDPKYTNAKKAAISQSIFTENEYSFTFRT